MTFHIITLFPQSFDSYLSQSIIKRAIEDKKIKVKFYNPRDFVKNKNQKNHRVDQKPYGGGPGMVIEALPVISAIEKAKRGKKDVKIIFLSPRGKVFDTSKAKSFAKKYKDIIIVSGRYEGIDARVRKVFKTESLSIGNYVLTGGEIPAMILIDVIGRQIKGVLGDICSLEENRISAENVYTRPPELIYKGKSYKVPKVLLSGNHGKIDKWRENH